jgi:hypothetical protein
MLFSEFESKLEAVLSLKDPSRELTAFFRNGLPDVEKDFFYKYAVKYHINRKHREFVYTFIEKSGLVFPKEVVLDICKQITNVPRETSDLYGALRVATGTDERTISWLLQKLILGTDQSIISSDLLFVFPEVKVFDPKLFLSCLKRCTLSPVRECALAGVFSLGLCDRSPEFDQDTSAFVSDSLEFFDDPSWLSKVDDSHLREVAGGMMTLASVLLDVELIERVLRYTLVSFKSRTASPATVRVLSTPFVMWLGDVERYLPNICDVYNRNFDSIDRQLPIFEVSEQFKALAYQRKQHLEMTPSPQIMKHQVWRKFGVVRFEKRKLLTS